jgi:hypothetical protein
MNTSEEHKGNQNLATNHKEKLGLEIPDGYFSRSKQEILTSIEKLDLPGKLIFGLRPAFAYPIAASLILLIGLLFWLQFADPGIKTQLSDIESIDFKFPKEDILISSLFVSDSDMDSFVNEYILNEVVLEAERSEQELENIFLNSLFVDDSLIDSYVDKNLIEKVVL